MIIFESLLTTFEVFFKATGEVAAIDLSLKQNHHNQVKLLQISDVQRIAP